MTATFLHGVETIETLVGPRPIKQVRSAVIGLVGTAPIHHVAADDRPALHDPELILSDRDNFTFGDDDVAGYSIPAALKAIQDQGAGTVIVINVFDPAVHKTNVAEAVLNVVDHKITLAHQDIISVIVKKNLDPFAVKVEGTDYTVDYKTGVISLLEAGTIYAEATAKVTYVRATPSAVDADDIVGATTNGVRTGMEALRNAASKFGFGPKIVIAPGYSTTAAVALAMQVISQKTKLRAVSLADIPIGASRDEVVEGRAPDGDIDVTIADERVYYCYPHLKVPDGEGTKLEPYSQRLAGLIAATDLELGYWRSPSNRPILGAVGLELPLTAVVNDPTCDVNAINEVGVGTVFTGFGLGLRSWGNRSSAFPGSTAITTFMAARRTIDMVDEAVELATLTYMDGPVGDVLITAVLDDVNAFIRTLISRGALVAGSRVEFFAEDNPSVDLAAGKLVFTKTMCPPPPAERITYKSVIDTNLLKLGA